MFREIKYGALFGKARAMSGKLLKRIDYIELMQKKTVSQVVSYLKSNTQYSPILSDIDENNFLRDHIENALKKDIIKDYSKLLKFARGSIKKFLKLYYMENEVQSLKLIFRSFETGKVSYEELEDSLVFMARHDEVNIPKLALSRNLEEFLLRLKGTPYYELLMPFVTDDSENRLFNMEMVLDLYLLTDLRTSYTKLLDRRDRKLIEGFLGIEADIFNIFWIYRSKRYYNMKTEIITSFAAPHTYRLKKKTIEELIGAQKFSDYVHILKNTPYHFLFNDGNEDLFEYSYWDYIYKYHKKQSLAHPFSIECVISYLRLKEIEVNNIIAIINGVHYNLPDKSMQRFVVGVNI